MAPAQNYAILNAYVHDMFLPVAQFLTWEPTSYLLRLEYIVVRYSISIALYCVVIYIGSNCRLRCAVLVVPMV